MLKEFMSKPLQLLSHAAHIRTQEVVFHPNCEQEIIETKKELFIVKRYNDTTQIYCITNVTNKKQQYRLGTHSTDILTHKVFEKHITIDAYATVWCKIQK